MKLKKYDPKNHVLQLLYGGAYFGVRTVAAGVLISFLIR